MILDSLRLEGQVALVMGTQYGLGQAIALALAEAGADISVLDFGNVTQTSRALGHAWRSQGDCGFSGVSCLRISSWCHCAGGWRLAEALK